MRTLIRETSLSDMPQIKQIIDHSFPRFFRYFAWHSVSDTKHPTLVSEVEGALAGFAKLTMFAIGDAKHGCILWIAVHPAYRRRGVGLSQTMAGVDWLKRERVEAVFATTHRKNSAAQATLRKAGFQRGGFFVLKTAFWVESGEFLQRYLVRSHGNRANT